MYDELLFDWWAALFITYRSHNSAHTHVERETRVAAQAQSWAFLLCVLHFYTFFFFSSFLSHFFLFFYFLFSYEVFCLSRPSRPFIHPTSHPTARVLLQCLARYFCVVQFLSPFLSYFSYFSFSSYFSLFIEQLTSVYLTRFDKGRKHLKEGGGGKGGGNSLFHYQASSLLPGLGRFLFGQLFIGISSLSTAAAAF